MILFPSENHKDHFIKSIFNFPSIEELGFTESAIKVRAINKNAILDYQNFRDLPIVNTSNNSVYLRFGLISIRKLFKYAQTKNETYCNELIWREFFTQILFHFPKVVTQNFKSKYDGISWRNDTSDFNKWKNGETPNWKEYR